MVRGQLVGRPEMAPRTGQLSEQSSGQLSATDGWAPVAVRGAGFALGTGAAGSDAGRTVWATFPGAWDGQCAETPTLPKTVPTSMRANAMVLSLRSDMVLKTPWVKERTDSETGCAAANRAAAMHADSSRGGDRADRRPISQCAASIAEG